MNTENQKLIYRHQHPASYRIFSTKLEVTEVNQKVYRIRDDGKAGKRRMISHDPASAHLTADSSLGSM